MGKYGKSLRPGGTQAFGSNYLLGLGSANGTDARASATLDAGISVDLVIRVPLRNSRNRALCCASAAADALFANCICHGDTPPLIRFLLL